MASALERAESTLDRPEWTDDGPSENDYDCGDAMMLEHQNEWIVTDADDQLLLRRAYSDALE